MTDVQRLIANYAGHADVDYVGLWQIAGRVEDDLGFHGESDIRRKTLQVVRGLIARGLCPGDYTTEGFSFWPGSKDEQLRRIETDWIALGKTPDLEDPICWLTLQRTGNEGRLS